MKDFRQLKVWAKAHELTLALYEATSSFPTDERYGLTSQIRRAASSIPANIAEGCGRRTDGELAQFVQTAMGSASELEYHLLLAHDLHLLHDDAYETLKEQVVEVKRMLAALVTRLWNGNATRTAGRRGNEPLTADR